MKNVITIFILIFIVSCKRPFFQEMKAFSELQWHMDSIAKFNFTINDTVQLYDFYVLIRHTNEYPYQNLYCFVTSLYPGEVIKCDTVNFILADEQGKWIGRKNGKFYDNEILISRKVRFEKAGVYSFEFVHAMRDTILNGIHSFGIKLVPVPYK
ncbi:MAG: gliding motility lipoprotein GldH [Bacteroidales bacterium]|nr:gliding motility lipoprotein GldH [Bacteroidales bacterium]